MRLNASKFANLQGVSNVTVSRWESEEVQIGLANNKLICLLFAIKLEKESNETIQLDVSGNYKPTTAPGYINIPVDSLNFREFTMPLVKYNSTIPRPYYNIIKRANIYPDELSYAA